MEDYRKLKNSLQEKLTEHQHLMALVNERCSLEQQ